MGVTSDTQIGSGTWYNPSCVMVHVKDLTLSQGAWRSAFIAPRVGEGTVIELSIDNEVMHVVVDGTEVSAVNVGPGRDKLCAELRWKGQALMLGDVERKANDTSTLAERMARFTEIYNSVGKDV